MIDQSPAAKVSRDLTEIVELSAQLLTQAVHDSQATIDGTSLPGGRAMIALANVGDVESFERRVELTERAWMATLEASGGVRVVDGVSVRLDPIDHRPDVAADEDDETAPALQVIRYWSERYRWQLGMVWDHIPTLETEAKFLRNPDVLIHIATHHADEWPHMARDINRARSHLESVLHAGRRPDKSRVVCSNPACEDPKALIRTYGRRYVVAWRCVACHLTLPEVVECTSCHRKSPVTSDSTCRRRVGRRDERRDCEGDLVSTVTLNHCPNRWCRSVAPAEAVYASNPNDDRWKCTSCKVRYDDDQFRQAHAKMLRHASAERFVSVREAVDTLIKQGRPEVTVRSWLQPPRRHVADRCTVCNRRWPAQEHNICPGKVKGSLELCGGELRPVRRGNPNNVIEAFCDVATHQVYVWWPDMWRRHLVTKDKADRRKRRADEQAATREATETG